MSADTTPQPSLGLASEFLLEAKKNFAGQKKLADAAVAQISDEQLFARPEAESNSVAVVMQHIAGNMGSRWTDFLTSDGEKPERNREAEFDEPAHSRERLLARWEEMWGLLFRVLEELKPEDVMRTVYIRRQPHTVMQAIVRQLCHYSQHVGQIVYVAKMLKGAEWTSLSIPRGKSEEFNQGMAEKFGK